MLPNKTMKFKGEKCVGGKMSKDRLTVMVAANMTGSEKIKLLVIGKAKSPRCFKNIKTLPVDYESNARAWMTSSLFEKIITQWDNRLFRQKKKILLLVDNCPAHPKISNLKAIKLVFLPANTTSVLQPMDQGVIKALKTEFRKLQMIKILQELETTDTPYKLNILDAILFISKAWDQVSQQTISNCFRHAGFRSQLVGHLLDSDEEDNLPLSKWLNLQKPADTPRDENIPLEEWIYDFPVQELATEENWKNFVDVDENLKTADDLTDVQILESVSENLDNETDDENVNENECRAPTIKEVYSAIQTVRNFFVLNNDIDLQVDPSLFNLEKIIERKYLSSKRAQKQSKLTDFFNKI